MCNFHPLSSISSYCPPVLVFHLCLLGVSLDTVKLTRARPSSHPPSLLLMHMMPSLVGGLHPFSPHATPTSSILSTCPAHFIHSLHMPRPLHSFSPHAPPTSSILFTCPAHFTHYLQCPAHFIHSLHMPRPLYPFSPHAPPILSILSTCHVHFIQLFPILPITLLYPQLLPQIIQTCLLWLSASNHVTRSGLYQNLSHVVVCTQTCQL